MGFRQWLIGLLGGSAENPSTSSLAMPLAADPMEEESAGLNFRTAIEAHQKWKARLQAVIDENSSESLSVEVISRDDQCALGKWIHGVGGQRFGHGDLFQKLRKNHAFFHVCAGRVLQLAQAGKKSDAQAILMSGDYARVSQDVVMDLAHMYKQVSEK
ncbi:MAG: CZB domain-containing protein [Gammaproteobacteria bacterium]